MTSEVATVVTPEPRPKDPVASISGQVTQLSTGDHALLRRMYLTNKPAAEGAVVKLLSYAGLKPFDYEDDYQAWRLLVHVTALLSGTGRAQSHDSRRSLGTALQDIGFSENRLLRLTAARGEPLQKQVALVGRMLAQAGGGPVNLRTLLHLVGRDPTKAEQARLRIAQDYYAAEARSEGDAK